MAEERRKVNVNMTAAEAAVWFEVKCQFRSLKDIADEFGITRERARQLLVAAEAKEEHRWPTRAR